LAFVELRDRLQDLVRRHGLNITLDREHFYPGLDQASMRSKMRPRTALCRPMKGCLFRRYHLAGTCAALGAQVGVGVSGQGAGGDVIKRAGADGARFEQRGLDPQRARLDDEGLN
jgi:hypothetical protein